MTVIELGALLFRLRRLVVLATSLVSLSILLVLGLILVQILVWRG